MTNIVITGSSGLVATELINLLLLTSDEYQIYAVTTSIERMRERYGQSKQVNVTTLADLPDALSGATPDTVIHCAFARSANPQQVASSLDYTRHIAEMSLKLGATTFVNISSQSVYGQESVPMWTESTTIAPNYLYALGKYATEQIVQSVFEGSTTRYTNIRLASVCENARFMNVFVKRAITGEAISIQGGKQICSFIDVRDVAEALFCVITHKSDKPLAKAYNLSRGDNVSIVRLAEIVSECSQELYNRPVAIEITPADIELNVGMDNSLFCNEFNWQPKRDYRDMILSLYVLNDSSLHTSHRGGVFAPFRSRYATINRKIYKLNLKH